VLRKSAICHNVGMAANVTRRQLAALAGLSLVPAEQAPAQPPQPSEDDLAIQRETLRRNRELMAKVNVPAALEPAFTFKA
jgi:hypothetical protein